MQEWKQERCFMRGGGEGLPIAIIYSSGREQRGGGNREEGACWEGEKKDAGKGLDDTGDEK